jgi:aminoglycoside phosphotransferase (APT) family kinase protein
MSELLPIALSVGDDEIASAIGGTVTELRRRPWEYGTSAPLEIVTVVSDDGQPRDFILKHLAPGDMSERARRAKPPFVVEPRREIEVYRRVLAPLNIGPRLVGSKCIPEAGTYWLLLERVDAEPLYEAGDVKTWVAVAQWLASFHARAASVHSGSLSQQARLLCYDRQWYTIWMDRARRFFASDDPGGSRHTRAALQWLWGRYERVIDRLVSRPMTLIHGEFYPSNVLVRRTGDVVDVYPIDWEMAAAGPGVIDLAALTSGDWSELDRQSMIAGYAESSGEPVAELIEAVAYAQIHLAVQWLGWFGRRQPPAAHARDWLSDAIDRAESLRV